MGFGRSDHHYNALSLIARGRARSIRNVKKELIKADPPLFERLLDSLSSMCSSYSGAFPLSPLDFRTSNLPEMSSCPERFFAFRKCRK